jgi:hypothetical protein
MDLVINPGTEPVEGTADQAATNMLVLLADLALDGMTWVRTPAADRGGRYAFRVQYAGREAEVRMPGLPLEAVRYQAGGNPWHFPRLYVNGSSWLWAYAVTILHARLTGRE